MPESPITLATNPQTCKVPDIEVLGQMGQRSAAGAQIIRGSILPASQSTLDSDDQDNRTLVILDDLYDTDHSRQRKPPPRLRCDFSEQPWS